MVAATGLVESRTRRRTLSPATASTIFVHGGAVGNHLFRLGPRQDRPSEERCSPRHRGDGRRSVAGTTVSPGHAAALADMSVVRCAVNQEYVDLSHPLATGDEVAFFPPVTGG